MFLLLCALAFALGAIPFGFLMGRVYGRDLREEGSKNIGATNTMRVLGRGPGLVVFALDVVKGYFPVLIAQKYQLEPWLVMGTGISAVLGHIYSPWVRFKGGKGVATTLGVLIGLSPIVAGLAFTAFVIVTAATRYVSLGSIVAALAQALLFVALPGHPLPYQLFGAVVGVFVIVRHRANIARLRAGTESKFTFGKSDR